MANLSFSAIRRRNDLKTLNEELHALNIYDAVRFESCFLNQKNQEICAYSVNILGVKRKYYLYNGEYYKQVISPTGLIKKYSSLLFSKEESIEKKIQNRHMKFFKKDRKELIFKDHPGALFAAKQKDPEKFKNFIFIVEFINAHAKNLKYHISIETQASKLILRAKFYQKNHIFDIVAIDDKILLFDGSNNHAILSPHIASVSIKDKNLFHITRTAFDWFLKPYPKKLEESFNFNVHYINKLSKDYINTKDKSVKYLISKNIKSYYNEVHDPLVKSFLHKNMEFIKALEQF